MTEAPDTGAANTEPVIVAVAGEDGGESVLEPPQDAIRITAENSAMHMRSVDDFMVMNLPDHGL
jgi:hypothetical protein